jgi:hypothetical protein
MQMAKVVSASKKEETVLAMAKGGGKSYLSSAMMIHPGRGIHVALCRYELGAHVVVVL